jgi:uncharacterized membrane protein
MNPFLLFSFGTAWVLFFLFLMLGYLDTRTGPNSSGYNLGALVFFIFGVFLTIACGGSWHTLHP